MTTKRRKCPKCGSLSVESQGLKGCIHEQRLVIWECQDCQAVYTAEEVLHDGIQEVFIRDDFEALAEGIAMIDHEYRSE